MVPMPPIKVINTAGQKHPKGERGKPGRNSEGIVDPKPSEFIDASHAINSYKEYVRENLANNIRETTLRQFISNIERDKRVRSLYDTMGLFNELQGLENQYLQLRNQFSFIPFHESLLNRTDDYAKANQETIDHSKVLKFIHTTLLGKISNLKNFKNHVLIIDLTEYLELVRKNIEKMSELEREVSIGESRQQYENSLMDKITSALEIINNQIIPALLEHFNSMSEDILHLIEEIIKRRDAAKKELAELQDKIRMFKVLGALKIVSTFAQFFGKIGNIVTKFIAMGVQTVSLNRQAFQSVLKALERALAPIVDFLKEPFKLYLLQLVRMHSLAESLPCFDDITNITSKYINITKKRLESNDLLDSTEIDVIRDIMRNALADVDCDDISMRKQLQNINEIKNIDSKVFRDIQNYTKKLDEYAKAEKKLEQQLEKWETRIMEIQKTMLPMFMRVQASIISITHGLGNKTQVELDVSVWQVQSMLGDLKVVFHKMSEETEIQNDLKREVEKLEETFGALVKVYDRIQSYSDQSKFAGYLADIQLPSSLDIADPKLRHSVLQLKKMLQTNVVMDQYEVAIHSFKQHQFPFAHIHLAAFDLPTGLQVNDTQTLVRRAVDEIDYLQEQLMFIDASIGKFDRETFGDIDFSSGNNSIAMPFFIFKSRDFKSEIKRLLDGEEILIKADIVKGIRQNAVKFNEIEIQFKMSDEKVQLQLNTELQNFVVRMTMVGNNYYRCGDKFYYLSIDDNAVIEYSFRKDQNSHKPSKFNDVYRKLSEKSYFLSPYTMWKIKLIKLFGDFPQTNVNETIIQNEFDRLKKFKSEAINLELRGHGQYFRNDGVFSTEVCNDEIKKYYNYDNTTTNFKSIESLRNHYNLLN